MIALYFLYFIPQTLHLMHNLQGRIATKRTFHSDANYVLKLLWSVGYLLNSGLGCFDFIKGILGQKIDLFLSKSFRPKNRERFINNQRPNKLKPIFQIYLWDIVRLPSCDIFNFNVTKTNNFICVPKRSKESKSNYLRPY